MTESINISNSKILSVLSAGESTCEIMAFFLHLFRNLKEERRFEMFDIFKSIFGAFVGRVKHDPEARKLVWIIILLSFLTLGISIFTAYVSYQRYLDFIHNLPNAETAAWVLTGGIAAAMLVITGTLALFTVELWIKKESRISYQAAIIFSAIGLFIGATDFHMNITGAEDVAEIMAGTVSTVNDQEIFDRYDKQIANHQSRIDAVMKRYTWKGKVWFAPSKYHPEYKEDKKIVDNANNQIAILEEAKTKALNRDTERFQTETTKREERKTSSHTTLAWAVRLAYILQFLVSLGMAYCGLVFERALDTAPSGSNLFSRVEKSNGVDRFAEDAILDIQNIKNQLNELYTAINKANDSDNPAPNKPQKIGFSQDQLAPIFPKKEPETRPVNPDEIKAIILDILGSMSGDNDTKYLYRHFNEDDAEKSRRKKEAKAISAAQEAQRLREETGLTVPQIAKRLGKSERTISRYLNPKS